MDLKKRPIRSSTVVCLMSRMFLHRQSRKNSSDISSQRKDKSLHITNRLPSIMADLRQTADSVLSSLSQWAAQQY